MNNTRNIPEVLGRICNHKGFVSLEVSCPYCGCLHHHSPQPIPGVRTAHCGLPQLCRTGDYLIKATYKGLPQPKRQPPDWLNFYGETVENIKSV